MFEYAISCGEGTLLDYGMGETYDIMFVLSDMTERDYDGGKFYDQSNESTVIIGPASLDCQTGK